MSKMNLSYKFNKDGSGRQYLKSFKVELRTHNGVPNSAAGFEATIIMLSSQRCDLVFAHLALYITHTQGE